MSNLLSHILCSSFQWKCKARIVFFFFFIHSVQREIGVVNFQRRAKIRGNNNEMNGLFFFLFCVFIKIAFALKLYAELNSLLFKWLADRSVSWIIILFQYGEGKFQYQNSNIECTLCTSGINVLPTLFHWNSTE